MNQTDFNPRAPCGALLPQELTNADANTFQSTRPLRGATPAPMPLPPGRCDFNPRAPCGARPTVYTICSQTLPISIHAPLAGRDERLPETKEDAE